MTKIPPTTMDISPFFIESDPREGPTVLSSIILTGAGSEPARRTMARSCASSAVKFPVMRAEPPEIFSWITGAEYTFLSKTIARRFLTFSSVILAKIRAPFLSKVIETYGSLYCESI